jgi:pimeloyl-ACP methyl ester carboxylesterase
VVLFCAGSGLMYKRPVFGDSTLRTSAPVHKSPSAKPSAVIQRDKDCRIIYLGFVGALEPAHNKSSGVVQIATLLQGNEFPDVCAKSFSPYVWGDGLRWLLTHFPGHAGALSTAELQHAPKVLLVGHSMGGWAMMSVARRLSSRGILVELTIQIDSVGFTDYTLPGNVKCAANFHARDVLMPLTAKRLRTEDPSRTKLLADVTVKGAGHESITRDPRIRELVLQTIESLRASFCVDLIARRPNPQQSAPNLKVEVAVDTPEATD